MSSLLETKELVKNFYSKNETYLNPILKFLLSFVIFILINSQIGYMTKLDSIIVVLVAALFCSFIPLRMTAILAGVFMLLHFYTLAPECALVAGVILIFMFLLYIRFVPKETIVVLITPILFALKIPYLIPIAMGLIGGPVSIISVTFGVIISYLIEYIKMNATTITSMDTESMLTKLRFIIDGLVSNKAMIITILAFAVTLLLVFIIRRRSIDHSWSIAIITGALTDVTFLLVGDFAFDLNYSILGIIFGTIIAGVVCRFLEFFKFNLDYKRTENVQFEDDDYYYYVKAVPKITVAAADKKVKKINTKRVEVTERPTGTIRTANGVKHNTSERQ